jgi:TolA-binding protein
LIAGLSLALTLGIVAPATAQTAVTTADIQRLQDEVYQASTDVSRLRTSDALQAGRLQDELDTLREDVIYLKVKLRKESSVSRAEYTQVRDQLQDLRARARGLAGRHRGRNTSSPTSGAPPVESAPIYDDRSADHDHATGTRASRRQEIDVRIQTELTSDTRRSRIGWKRRLVDLGPGRARSSPRAPGCVVS